MNLGRARRWARWLFRQGREAPSFLLDLVFGVRTTSFEPLPGRVCDDLAFDAARPSDWLSTWWVLRSLDVDRSEVLADIGAGAGRALVIAGLFPFGRLIGIERDPGLGERAVRNLARRRFRASGEATIVIGDARTFDLPDDVTVVFLFNPFGSDTFRTVIANLVASLERAPRYLRLVYENPKEHQHLMAHGRFQLIGRFPGIRLTSAWAAIHVYEVQRQHMVHCPATPQVVKRSTLDDVSKK